MSLVKDPSGSFYLESDQFNVDYEENSIKFVGKSGEGTTYTAGEGITISGNTISVDQEKIPTNTSMGEAISKCLSLDGGIMNADANIQATDEITITSTSGNNTCSLGVTASGAEIINTNDGVTSSVRATSGGIELKANDTTISLTSENIDLNGANLNHVGTDVDLNNHKITNLGAPTEANDAMNKATADATYATKAEIANFITNDKLPTAATTSVAGIVKQAAAVTDASDNAVTTINELLVSLRNAGILASS
mgnify:CR=1 FL=1